METKAIPIKYSLKKSKSEQKAKLYYLTNDSAVISSPTKKGEFIRIPTSEILYIKGKKQKRSGSLDPILGPNTKLKLDIKNRKDKAWVKVKDIEDGKLIVDPVDDKPSNSIEEDKIEGFTFDNEEPKKTLSKGKFRYTHLVPGIYQYHQEGTYWKIKGGVMFGMFVGLVAFLPAKFVETQKAPSEIYLPVNGSIFVFQDNSSYNAARSQFYTAAAALTALYAYHGYELYSHVYRGKKTSFLMGVTPEMNMAAFANPYSYVSPSQGNRQSSFFFKYQYSF
ncbi:MAG: hypothetical protein AAF518_22280 [Spirochaetota bacterium]